MNTAESTGATAVDTCRFCADPVERITHQPDGGARLLRTCHCGWAWLESYAGDTLATWSAR